MKLFLHTDWFEFDPIDEQATNRCLAAFVLPAPGLSLFAAGLLQIAEQLRLVALPQRFQILSVNTQQPGQFLESWNDLGLVVIAQATDKNREIAFGEMKLISQQAIENFAVVELIELPHQRPNLRLRIRRRCPTQRHQLLPRGPFGKE